MTTEEETREAIEGELSQTTENSQSYEIHGATEESSITHHKVQDEASDHVAGASHSSEGQVFIEALSEVHISFSGFDLVSHEGNAIKEEGSDSIDLLKKGLNNELEDTKDEPQDKPLKLNLSSNSEIIKMSTTEQNLPIIDKSVVDERAGDREILSEATTVMENKTEEPNAVDQQTKDTEAETADKNVEANKQCYIVTLEDSDLESRRATYEKDCPEHELRFHAAETVISQTTVIEAHVEKEELLNESTNDTSLNQKEECLLHNQDRRVNDKEECLVLSSNASSSHQHTTSDIGEHGKVEESMHEDKLCRSLTENQLESTNIREEESLNKDEEFSVSPEHTPYASTTTVQEIHEEKDIGINEQIRRTLAEKNLEESDSIENQKAVNYLESAGSETVDKSHEIFDACKNAENEGIEEETLIYGNMGIHVSTTEVPTIQIVQDYMTNPTEVCSQIQKESVLQINDDNSYIDEIVTEECKNDKAKAKIEGRSKDDNAIVNESETSEGILEKDTPPSVSEEIDCTCEEQENKDGEHPPTNNMVEDTTKSGGNADGFEMELGSVSSSSNQEKIADVQTTEFNKLAECFGITCRPLVMEASLEEKTQENDAEEKTYPEKSGYQACDQDMEGNLYEIAQKENYETSEDQQSNKYIDLEDEQAAENMAKENIDEEQIDVEEPQRQNDENQETRASGAYISDLQEVSGEENQDKHQENDEHKDKFGNISDEASETRILSSEIIPMKDDEKGTPGNGEQAIQETHKVSAAQQGESREGSENASNTVDVDDVKNTPPFVSEEVDCTNEQQKNKDDEHPPTNNMVEDATKTGGNVDGFEVLLGSVSSSSNQEKIADVQTIEIDKPVECFDMTCRPLVMEASSEEKTQENGTEEKTYPEKSAYQARDQHVEGILYEVAEKESYETTEGQQSNKYSDLEDDQAAETMAKGDIDEEQIEAEKPQRQNDENQKTGASGAYITNLEEVSGEENQDKYQENDEYKDKFGNISDEASETLILSSKSIPMKHDKKGTPDKQEQGIQETNQVSAAQQQESMEDSEDASNTVDADDEKNTLPSINEEVDCTNEQQENKNGEHPPTNNMVEDTTNTSGNADVFEMELGSVSSSSNQEKFAGVQIAELDKPLECFSIACTPSVTKASSEENAPENDVEEKTDPEKTACEAHDEGVIYEVAQIEGHATSKGQQSHKYIILEDEQAANTMSKGNIDDEQTETEKPQRQNDDNVDKGVSEEYIPSLKEVSGEENQENHQEIDDLENLSDNASNTHILRSNAATTKDDQNKGTPDKQEQRIQETNKVSVTQQKCESTEDSEDTSYTVDTNTEKVCIDNLDDIIVTTREEVEHSSNMHEQAIESTWTDQLHKIVESINQKDDNECREDEPHYLHAHESAILDKNQEKNSETEIAKTEDSKNISDLINTVSEADGLKEDTHSVLGRDGENPMENVRDNLDHHDFPQETESHAVSRENEDALSKSKDILDLAINKENSEAQNLEDEVKLIGMPEDKIPDEITTVVTFETGKNLEDCIFNEKDGPISNAQDLTGESIHSPEVEACSGSTEVHEGDDKLVPEEVKITGSATSMPIFLNNAEAELEVSTADNEPGSDFDKSMLQNACKLEHEEKTDDDMTKIEVVSQNLLEPSSITIEGVHRFDQVASEKEGTQEDIENKQCSSLSNEYVRSPDGREKMHENASPKDQCSILRNDDDDDQKEETTKGEAKVALQTIESGEGLESLKIQTSAGDDIKVDEYEAVNFETCCVPKESIYLLHKSEDAEDATNKYEEHTHRTFGDMPVAISLAEVATLEGLHEVQKETGSELTSSKDHNLEETTEAHPLQDEMLEHETTNLVAHIMEAKVVNLHEETSQSRIDSDLFIYPAVEEIRREVGKDEMQSQENIQIEDIKSNANNDGNREAAFPVLAMEQTKTGATQETINEEISSIAPLSQLCYGTNENNPLDTFASTTSQETINEEISSIAPLSQPNEQAHEARNANTTAEEAVQDEVKSIDKPLDLPTMQSDGVEADGENEEVRVMDDIKPDKVQQFDDISTADDFIFSDKSSFENELETAPTTTLEGQVHHSKKEAETKEEIASEIENKEYEERSAELNETEGAKQDYSDGKESSERGHENLEDVHPTKAHEITTPKAVDLAATNEESTSKLIDDLTDTYQPVEEIEVMEVLESQREMKRIELDGILKNEVKIESSSLMKNEEEKNGMSNMIPHSTAEEILPHEEPANIPFDLPKTHEPSTEIEDLIDDKNLTITPNDSHEWKEEPDESFQEDENATSDNEAEARAEPKETAAMYNEDPTNNKVIEADAMPNTMINKDAKETLHISHIAIASGSGVLSVPEAQNVTPTAEEKENPEEEAVNSIDMSKTDEPSIQRKDITDDKDIVITPDDSHACKKEPEKTSHAVSRENEEALSRSNEIFHLAISKQNSEVQNLEDKVKLIGMPEDRRPDEITAIGTFETGKSLEDCILNEKDEPISNAQDLTGESVHSPEVKACSGPTGVHKGDDKLVPEEVKIVGSTTSMPNFLNNAEAELELSTADNEPGSYFDKSMLQNACTLEHEEKTDDDMTRITVVSQNLLKPSSITSEGVQGFDQVASEKEGTREDIENKKCSYLSNDSVRSPEGREDASSKAQCSILRNDDDDDQEEETTKEEAKAALQTNKSGEELESLKIQTSAGDDIKVDEYEAVNFETSCVPKESIYILQKSEDTEDGTNKYEEHTYRTFGDVPVAISLAEVATLEGLHGVQKEIESALTSSKDDNLGETTEAHPHQDEMLEDETTNLVAQIMEAKVVNLHEETCQSRIDNDLFIYPAVEEIRREVGKDEMQSQENIQINEDIKSNVNNDGNREAAFPVLAMEQTETGANENSPLDASASPTSQETMNEEISSIAPSSQPNEQTHEAINANTSAEETVQDEVESIDKPPDLPTMQSDGVKADGENEEVRVTDGIKPDKVQQFDDISIADDFISSDKSSFENESETAPTATLESQGHHSKKEGEIKEEIASEIENKEYHEGSSEVKETEGAKQDYSDGKESSERGHEDLEDVHPSKAHEITINKDKCSEVSSKEKETLLIASNEVVIKTSEDDNSTYINPERWLSRTEKNVANISELQGNDVTEGFKEIMLKQSDEPLQAYDDTKSANTKIETQKAVDLAATNEESTSKPIGDLTDTYQPVEEIEVMEDSESQREMKQIELDGILQNEVKIESSGLMKNEEEKNGMLNMSQHSSAEEILPHEEPANIPFGLPKTNEPSTETEDIIDDKNLTITPDDSHEWKEETDKPFQEDENATSDNEAEARGEPKEAAAMYNEDPTNNKVNEDNAMPLEQNTMINEDTKETLHISHMAIASGVLSLPEAKNVTPTAEEKENPEEEAVNSIDMSKTDEPSIQRKDITDDKDMIITPYHSRACKREPEKTSQEDENATSNKEAQAKGEPKETDAMYNEDPTNNKVNEADATPLDQNTVMNEDTKESLHISSITITSGEPSLPETKDVFPPTEEKEKLEEEAISPIDMPKTDETSIQRKDIIDDKDMTTALDDSPGCKKESEKPFQEDGNAADDKEVEAKGEHKETDAIHNEDPANNKVNEADAVPLQQHTMMKEEAKETLHMLYMAIASERPSPLEAKDVIPTAEEKEKPEEVTINPIDMPKTDETGTEGKDITDDKDMTTTPDSHAGKKEPKKPFQEDENATSDKEEEAKEELKEIDAIHNEDPTNNKVEEDDAMLLEQNMMINRDTKESPHISSMTVTSGGQSLPEAKDAFPLAEEKEKLAEEAISPIDIDSAQKEEKEQIEQDYLPVSRFLMVRILRQESDKVDDAVEAKHANEEANTIEDNSDGDIPKQEGNFFLVAEKITADSTISKREQEDLTSSEDSYKQEGNLLSLAAEQNIADTTISKREQEDHKSSENSYNLVEEQIHDSKEDTKASIKYDDEHRLSSFHDALEAKFKDAEEKIMDKDSVVDVPDEEGKSVSLPPEQTMTDATIIERKQQDLRCSEESYDLVEEQNYDSKKDTETSTENDNVGIHKEEGKSASLSPNQITTDTAISEIKQQYLKCLEYNSDLVEKQFHDTKKHTETSTENDDGGQQNNLCNPPQTSKVDDDVKNEISDKLPLDNLIDLESKVDNKEVKTTDPQLDTKVPVTDLNKQFNISTSITEIEEDILQGGGKEGAGISHGNPKNMTVFDAAREQQTSSSSELVLNGKGLLVGEETVASFDHQKTGESFESSKNEDNKLKDDWEMLSKDSEIGSEEKKDKMSDYQIGSEESVVSDSQIALESTKELVEVDEKILEVPAVSPDEKQIKNVVNKSSAEEKADHENDERNEEEERKAENAGQDLSLTVEARGTDLKLAHKKSHNILSGVGSKVKHSLAKVKKAITGKSTHSKTPHQDK